MSLLSHSKSSSQIQGCEAISFGRDIAKNYLSCDQNAASPHRDLYQLSTHSNNFLAETVEYNQASSLVVAHIPGWTENVDHNFARQRVDLVTQGLGATRSISLGHNGVGIKGLTDRATRLQVARTRLSALKASTQPGQKHLLIGSSIGTNVLAEMLTLNLRDAKPLEIAGVINFVPAVRRPESPLSLETVVQFTGQVVSDGSREFASRPISELVRNVGSLATWGYENVQSSKNLYHHLIELMKPIPEAQMSEVVSSYPTLVLYGSKDKIVDKELWQKLSARHPGSLQMVSLGGHGHEVMLNPKRTANKITREISNQIPNL